MFHIGYACRAKESYPTQAFGLKETKAKVDLMEDLYDHPMEFDEAWVPPASVAGQGVGAWGEGVLFTVQPKVTGGSICNVLLVMHSVTVHRDQYG